jgi:predicted nucleic acid-binding Zn ribbon protein
MSPIFEYQCPKCGGRVEKYCIGERTVLCYYCSCGEPMDKLVSAPGLFDVKGHNAKNGYNNTKKDIA